MNIRELFERVMNGTLVEPTVTTSFAELHDPSKGSVRRPGGNLRRNFSQLLGVVATTPEEPVNESDGSPATSAERGPDQPGAKE